VKKTDTDMYQNRLDPQHCYTEVDERARVVMTTSVAKFIRINLPEADIHTST
jgi:hypothetical protein